LTSSSGRYDNDATASVNMLLLHLECAQIGSIQIPDDVLLLLLSGDCGSADFNPLMHKVAKTVT